MPRGSQLGTAIIIASQRNDTRDQQTKRKCCVSDGGRVSEVEYIYNPRGKEGDSE